VARGPAWKNGHRALVLFAEAKMKLTVLSTLDGLESALSGSGGRPLLLLKHSLTCGTSAYAHEEVEDFLSEPGLPVDACVVHVQTGRAVSNAIAERFGIRHESPQLLLIANGQVVWQASHHRITRREIAAALKRHVAAPPGHP
jgi:bacillithiol system protein YtxJ